MSARDRNPTRITNDVEFHEIVRVATSRIELLWSFRIVLMMLLKSIILSTIVRSSKEAHRFGSHRKKSQS
jgi:hypothetical protein